MNKSIIRHFFDIAGGTVITLIVGILTTPIITRLVSPNDYGQLSLFSMYANIAMLVFGLGLDQSLIRFFYKEDTKEYKSKLFHKCIYLPIVFLSALFCILIIFSGIISKVLDIPISIQVLFYIYIILLILNRFSILLLRLEYKTREYSFLNICQKIIYVITALILIISVKKSYFLMLVIATVTSNLIVTFGAIVLEKELWSRNNKNIDVEVNMKELIWYGIPFIFSYGVTTLFQSIDKISLNYYCTVEQVGVYSSAMTIINIFAIIQSTFTALWFPMAMEHYEKNPNEKLFYVRANEVISAIMLLLGFTLIFLKDIFALFLGSSYREAAYILPFLIFNPIMYTVSETTVTGIAFAKKSKYNIFVALGACISNLLGNMILVPMYGPRGAAISTGISYIIFFILRTFISNKFYKVEYKIKKFYFIVIIAIIYSLYCTFNSFNLQTVIGFILLCGITLFLYRNVISIILNIVFKIYNDKIKKIKRK